MLTPKSMGKLCPPMSLHSGLTWHQSCVSKQPGNTRRNTSPEVTIHLNACDKEEGAARQSKSSFESKTFFAAAAFFYA